MRWLDQVTSWVVVSFPLSRVLWVYTRKFWDSSHCIFTTYLPPVAVWECKSAWKHEAHQTTWKCTGNFSQLYQAYVQLSRKTTTSGLGWAIVIKKGEKKAQAEKLQWEHETQGVVFSEGTLHHFLNSRESDCKKGIYISLSRKPGFVSCQFPHLPAHTVHIYRVSNTPCPW